jgi:hypothetical protein
LRLCEHKKISRKGTKKPEAAKKYSIAIHFISSLKNQLADIIPLLLLFACNQYDSLTVRRFALPAHREAADLPAGAMMKVDIQVEPHVE